MNKGIALLILCIIMPSGFVLSEEKPQRWVPTPEERVSQPWIPARDEVVIGEYGVSMPLERILLARKDSEYCALKFMNTWLGETNHDHYTSYEFYLQADGSGDFSKSNIIRGTGELFFPRVRSFLGLPYLRGAKDTIKCGGMNFEWLYIATITINDAEYAPTPWTSITDVNVHDPRIKWYRKDKNRKAIIMHIDKLWDQPKVEEGNK